MSRRTTRRRFMQESAVAGLGFWAAGGIALAAEGKAANDKVHIACIGVGGKGSSDVDGASHVGKIVALCDVDDNTLAKKAAHFPEAQKFADYREMLDKLGDKIDAVTVSTPDHTHAPASLMAMKKGKDVYCQKPLTHTVAEAREMRDVAAKMKVATQMGNQGSAENGLREAVEIVQAGAIGPVARGPRLDEPPDLAAGADRHGDAQRLSADPAEAALEPLARRGADAAVSQRL